MCIATHTLGSWETLTWQAHSEKLLVQESYHEVQAAGILSELSSPKPILLGKNTHKTVIIKVIDTLASRC